MTLIFIFEKRNFISFAKTLIKLKDPNQKCEKRQLLTLSLGDIKINLKNDIQTFYHIFTAISWCTY